jgi:hypothetical protein
MIHLLYSMCSMRSTQCSSTCMTHHVILQAETQGRAARMPRCTMARLGALNLFCCGPFTQAMAALFALFLMFAA